MFLELPYSSGHLRGCFVTIGKISFRIEPGRDIKYWNENEWGVFRL